MTVPAIQLGLQRITRVLSSLGHPELSVPVIHVAGTNGKGSVGALVSAILRAAAVPHLRFASPPLCARHEAVEHDGEPVASDEFDWAARDVETADLELGSIATAFEKDTATAFLLFSRLASPPPPPAATATSSRLPPPPPPKLAIVEVGMGGLTDATNVVPRERTALALITQIDLDHERMLGGSLREIASHKAGIIKPPSAASEQEDLLDVVVAPQSHHVVSQVIAAQAHDAQARLVCATEPLPLSASPSSHSRLANPARFSLPTLTGPNSGDAPDARPFDATLALQGPHQLHNASAALCAAQVLRTSSRALRLVPELANISDEAIRQGFASARWPGRLSWIDLALTHPHDDDDDDDGSSKTTSKRRRDKVLVDGAHNPSSATALAAYLDKLDALDSDAARAAAAAAGASERQDKLGRTTLIVGLSAGRDARAILSPLLLSSPQRFDTLLAVGFSRPDNMPWVAPMDPDDVVAAARELQPALLDARAYASFDDAWRALNSAHERWRRDRDERQHLREPPRALVAGSLYLVADVYRHLRAHDGRELSALEL